MNRAYSEQLVMSQSLSVTSSPNPAAKLSLQPTNEKASSKPITEYDIFLFNIIMLLYNSLYCLSYCLSDYKHETLVNGTIYNKKITLYA